MNTDSTTEEHPRTATFYNQPLSTDLNTSEHTEAATAAAPSLLQGRATHDDLSGREARVVARWELLLRLHGRTAREARVAARWERLLLSFVPLLAAGDGGPPLSQLPWRRSTLPRLTLEVWRHEREAHAPCRRFCPQGAPGGGMFETLAPERVWDGWEWVANPDAPSAEVMAGPNMQRPFAHPAEEVRREAAEAARGGADAEDELESMYGRAAYQVGKVGLAASNLFDTGDDEGGDGKAQLAYLTWAC